MLWAALLVLFLFMQAIFLVYLARLFRRAPAGQGRLTLWQKLEARPNHQKLYPTPCTLLPVYHAPCTMHPEIGDRFLRPPDAVDCPSLRRVCRLCLGR